MSKRSMSLAAKCQHCTMICYLSEYLLLPYPMTYVVYDNDQDNNQLTKRLYWNIIKINNTKCHHWIWICHFYADSFILYGGKVISYSLNNDKHDNDFMINWPYFPNEISSKSTVTTSLKKWDHCVWIRDFSADPLIAHSMMNLTMIIWSTDHIFLMKYHQNP